MKTFVRIKYLMTTDVFKTERLLCKCYELTGPANKLNYQYQNAFIKRNNAATMVDCYVLNE